MPCSAVECRREGSTLPVSIVRPVLDTSDYSSRSKYSDGYLRRSSLSKTSETTRTTDFSRYSSSRSAVLSRSEETSRANRDSSRVRAHSHSDGGAAAITMATRPPRKPVTTFDIAEFRSLYSPESYVVGSSTRTSDSGVYSRESSSSYSRESSTYSRDSSLMPRDTSLPYSSSRPPLDTLSLRSSRTVTAKTEPQSSSATSSEVTTTDENHNIASEAGPSNTDASATSSQQAELLDEPQASADTTDDSQENFQPRIVTKSAVQNTSTKKETESRDTNGLSGLRNIGNTCFLNSVVQCLSNTRLLKDYLINKDYITDVNNSDSRGALIKSFAEVVQELWGGEGRIVNTSAFKSQVQKYAPRFMGYSQQDAQEFLRYLLQGIHDDVNRVLSKPRNLPPVDDNLSDNEKAVECWRHYVRLDDSRIVDLFVGQLKSTLRCTVCGHCSTTFEVFWDLSLPLPSRAGNLRLSQCLEHFTKEEVLDGDEMPTCCKCKTRRKCTKSFSIYKFPKILVLHLKRFSPSERYRKLSATVEFPLTGLDMSGYASATSAPTYNLYAVSNHSGTAYSGHYTAYCLHPHSHSWHEYNDSRVSSISGRNVVSSEAYILFYEQASAASSVTTSRL